MKERDILKIADELMEEAYKLLQKKNSDYSNSDDALAGFKLTAEEVGIGNYQAWLVYARKHWSAISTFCRRGGQVESEPIRERLKDMINYCCLLDALIQDNDDSKSIKETIKEINDQFKPKVDSNPNAFNSNISK